MSVAVIDCARNGNRWTIQAVLDVCTRTIAEWALLSAPKFGIALVALIGAVPLWSQATNVFPSSGNVGIGTTAPTQLLTINGGITEIRSGGYLMLRPTQNNWDMRLNSVGTRLDILSGGDLLNPIATFVHGGKVGIGTTSPPHKLSVEGTIGAREVIVTNAPWSDYVFRPGYRLRPLPEVATYIRKHGHLPEIPSEADVKEKGIGVGEMQAKLLAKIEELTLHMIQMEQQNRELQERMARLEKALAANGGDQ